MMFRNVLSNWGALLITAVLSLILTPLLIHRLGPFYFGLWMLVGSVVEHCGLLELGMRTALFRFASRFHGTRDRTALNETVVSAFAVACSIGIVVLIIILPLVFVLPGFFHIPVADRMTFRWVLIFLGMATALSFPGRMLGTYLSSLQRFDLYSLGEISAALLRLVGIITVLWLGWAVTGVSAVALLCSIALISIFAVAVHRVDPGLALHKRHFRWTRVRQLASFSAYAFIGSLGDYLRFSTDSVVISRMLNVALVTPFSIPNRITQYFKSVVVALGAPLNARLNVLDAQHKMGEMQELFLRATRLTTAVSGCLGILLLIHGRDLIRLWVGDMPAAYPVLTILVIGYIVELSQHPAVLVMLVRSRQRLLAGLTVAEGAANLVLSIWWAPRYGLTGVALGTVVPMVLARITVHPWFALRALDLRVSRYLREALLGPTTVGIVSWYLCWKIHHATVQPSIFAVGLQMTWQCLAFMVLFYIFGCRADDHVLIRGKLEQLWRRLSFRQARISVSGN